MNQGAERRGYLRADLGVFIKEGQGERIQIARVVDVSEGGIRYFMPPGMPKPSQQELELEFTLPGEELPLHAHGRMVAEAIDGKSQITSVVFTAIKIQDASRIRQYVIQRKRTELFDCLRREHLHHAAA